MSLVKRAVFFSNVSLRNIEGIFSKLSSQKKLVLLGDYVRMYVHFSTNRYQLNVKYSLP
jgi:hypothetical protein